ncbi:MAG: hypothetical protein IKU44_05275 [Firmicutes bacterium]|nr:hypothetical protein [Bacillota bacterium]
MRRAKSKLFTLVMIGVFFVAMVFAGATYAHGAETGPYGWKVTYKDSKNDGELVTVELPFEESSYESVKLPCECRIQDVLDSITVTGYDRNGNSLTPEIEFDDLIDYGNAQWEMERADGTYGVYGVNLYIDDHRMKETHKSPTCIEAGYFLNTCYDCGVEQRLEDTAEGFHKWGKMTMVTKRSYFNEGKETRICKVCKAEDEDNTIIYQKKTLNAPAVVGMGLTPKFSTTSGYDDIHVSWAKVSSATGYQVQYRIKGGKWKDYNKGKIIKGREIFLKNMEDGKWYQARVRSVLKSANGKQTAYSAWASDDSIMTLAKVKITSIKKSGNYVTVKWKGIPTSGEDGYEIYRATSKNGKYVKVAEVGQKSKEYPSVKIKHPKGMTYYYKIKAYSRWDGEHFLYGPWSDKVKCTR